MALTIHTLVSALLLLILTSITAAFPLFPSQSSVAANLTACALSPLLIEQFSAFSGSASVKPHITFFLTNPNGGAPGKMLCTATLGDGEGNFNGSKFYSCEQVGSGFSYRTAGEGDGEGRLSVFQYQICTVGLVNTVSHQILISASGSIATTSYPGEHGGEYSESVTGSANIAVTRIQEVQNINGRQGRLEDGVQGGNVTCGFVGPDKVVISLGSCDLGSTEKRI